MNTKYELIDGNRNMISGGQLIKLYRIKALRDFGDVHAGDIGGFVQSERNLSSKGDCWIYDDAIAWESARVSGNAKLYDHCEVESGSRIMGNVELRKNVLVKQFSEIMGNVVLDGNIRVICGCKVLGKGFISGVKTICGFTKL